MGQYIGAARSKAVAQVRLGSMNWLGLPWGEQLTINGVSVSFFPAGHILGSAQLRIEYRGQVWVCSGDYKVEPDRTCDAFEPVRCQVFITESTFGLPIYRWQKQSEIFAQINSWWEANRQAGQASVLYAYSLGKAQRILAGVDPSIGPLVCHSAVIPLNDAYRATGIDLPLVHSLSDPNQGDSKGMGNWAKHGALIIAPPSIQGAAALQKIGGFEEAFASGWMRLRGARRRRKIDRGFVLSDHADWDGLHQAIDATGAEQVIVTHGYDAIMVRALEEKGLQARSFTTEFGQEVEADSPA